MSAIRPLATIAMLIVLGIFLWTRINAPGLEQTTEGELAASDLPPLALDLGEGAASLESSPPPFSPADPATGETADGEFAFGPADEPQANNTITPLTPADTAAMPDLPPLPDNVPTADYSATDSETGTASGRVPSLGTQVPPAAVAETTPGDDAMMADPLASDLPDLPMGAGEEFATSSSAFAAARPAIQAALDRGDLQQAHLLLSGWYGDRSLTAAEPRGSRPAARSTRWHSRLLARTPPRATPHRGGRRDTRNHRPEVRRAVAAVGQD